MTNDGFALTSLVITHLWDEADWKGVVYGVDPNGANPPFLGILFKNATPGRQIFDDWLHRFGSFDEFDEIRIAIIEGDIPGKGSGYTVTIGSDIEGIISRAKQEGQDVDVRYIATVTRSHRLNPQPDSQFLPGFKKAFQRFNEYLLLPAFGSQTQPQPDFKYAIRKRKINFRKAGDVNEKDMDSIIFS